MLQMIGMTRDPAHNQMFMRVWCNSCSWRHARVSSDWKYRMHNKYWESILRQQPPIRQTRITWVPYEFFIFLWHISLNKEMLSLFIHPDLLKTRGEIRKTMRWNSKQLKWTNFEPNISLTFHFRWTLPFNITRSR